MIMLQLGAYMKKPGFLLVIEGIDGAGKSTLLTSLADHLRREGFDVLVTREPGGTPFGQGLRELLQHSSGRPNPVTEYLLFAADRSEHIKTVVKPALESGMVVISDRMGDSSMAYQGYGRGIDLSMITAINEWVMDGIKPDLVLYVRLDWETALQRIYATRATLTAFEQEKKDFFARVIAGFDEIFNQKRLVCILDGTCSPEELTKQAFTAVLSQLKRE